MGPCVVSFILSNFIPMGLFDYPDNGTTIRSSQDVTILDSLAENEWSRLISLVETLKFRKGDLVVRAGERDPSFFIILQGTVDVVAGQAGAETVLASLSEGSVFGEIAFFDGAPRSADIRATSAGTAVRISRSKFDYISAWEPRIASLLLMDLGKVLASRLRWTTAALAAATAKS